MSQHTTVGAPTLRRPRLQPRRIFPAIGAANVSNVAIILIAGAIGADMVVTTPAGSQAVPLIVVIMATAIPLLLGFFVVNLLMRQLPTIRIWAAWAVAVIAIATAPTTFFAAADPTTAIALALTHVVVGVAWFIALQPWKRDAR